MTLQIPLGHALCALLGILEEISLVFRIQGKFFQNAPQYSKRMCKCDVANWLNQFEYRENAILMCHEYRFVDCLLEPGGNPI